MKKSTKVFLTLFWVTIIINICAWISTPFSNFYRKYVFGFTLNTYGRITGIFPFSVGEIMIIIGIILLILLCVLFCVYIFLKTGLILRFLKVVVCIIVCVGFVMTSNCFVLYHCTTFGDEYLEKPKDYEFEKLRNLRNNIVLECNRLSKAMNRNEKGEIVYSGDIKAEAVLCMKKLGNTYPSLSGFYPEPKNIAFSGFLSQQGVLGVFFPFSMEANINSKMYILNYPATICHELAHVKGYIFEDDANFIGYLAAKGSDDDFFKYSAYISVLYYVDSDYINSPYYEPNDEDPEIEEEVYFDDVFLTDEVWKEVNENAIVDTDIVWNISDVATDTSLKINGVKEGSNSYSYVVKLLLRYGDMCDEAWRTN